MGRTSSIRKYFSKFWAKDNLYFLIIFKSRIRMIKLVSLLITAIFTLSCSLSFADMNFTGSEDDPAMPKSNGDHAAHMALVMSRQNDLVMRAGNFAGSVVVGAASGAASNDGEEGVAVGSWDPSMNEKINYVEPPMEMPDAEPATLADQDPVDILDGEAEMQKEMLEELKKQEAVLMNEIAASTGSIPFHKSRVTAQENVLKAAEAARAVALDALAAAQTLYNEFVERFPRTEQGSGMWYFYLGQATENWQKANQKVGAERDILNNLQMNVDLEEQFLKEKKEELEKIRKQIVIILLQIAIKV